MADRNMKKTLVILNLVAAALALTGGWLVRQSDWALAATLYRELEYRGIVDSGKVSEAWPEDWPSPADSPRTAFADVFRDRSIVSFLVNPCVAGFLLNALMIAKWMDRKRKPNHGLESTGAPPAAGTPETHP
jgi:hypothetical protein